MSTNHLMTQSKNKTKTEGILIILVFLDLKPEGQAPLVEDKTDLSGESSIGTNNK